MIACSLCLNSLEVLFLIHSGLACFCPFMAILPCIMGGDTKGSKENRANAGLHHLNLLTPRERTHFTFGYLEIKSPR